ncbi:hypothetical protein O4H52_07995 [Sphingomonadaceae bacterium G21617-S1]|nr:hypothetical protein [Sphingomonadaceae bacterium G21617-S1]
MALEDSTIVFKSITRFPRAPVYFTGFEISERDPETFRDEVLATFVVTTKPGQESSLDSEVSNARQVMAAQLRRWADMIETE